MIQSIQFTNFKALRQTFVPLAPFTLLLGPNGSGKSSVLQALQGIATMAAQQCGVQRPASAESVLVGPTLRSVTVADTNAVVEIKLQVEEQQRAVAVTYRWPVGHNKTSELTANRAGTPPSDPISIVRWLARMQVYALDPRAIAQPAQVSAASFLDPNGAGLAAVLDDLKDNHPERWDALLAEMRQWLPEYDFIFFNKPGPGQKQIALRTRTGGHRIAATELSQGTLLALVLLTLAHLPEPPSLLALEEIDRGLHPRLLRHLQDALYRLSYPEGAGETRSAIQVIATTHSPYLLDLYREHPEEIVLAEKKGLEVQMRRLSDIAHYDEILGQSPLSEVWYSGVLGGVSVKP